MVGCVSPNLCFGSGKPYFELFPLVKLAKIPAKKFLKKGYSIQETRDAVGIYKNFEPTLVDEDIPNIINDKNAINLRLNNIDNVKLGVIKTDPDVQEFLDNLKNE